jgi:hypothetical protein
MNKMHCQHYADLSTPHDYPNSPIDILWLRGRPSGFLLDDVDAMDEEDETLGWFGKVLPIRRDNDKSSPEVLFTAVASKMELNDPNDDPMLYRGDRGIEGGV